VAVARSLSSGRMRDGVQDNATTRAIARLRRHRYGALVDGLIDEPSFLAKSMFGGMACYLHGRMMLILTDRRPPWRGVLVATGHESHASLRQTLPTLIVHPIISKWLYLGEDAPDFEECAGELVELILQDDPRLGVESKPRAPRRRAAAKPKRPKARVPKSRG